MVNLTEEQVAILETCRPPKKCSSSTAASKPPPPGWVRTRKKKGSDGDDDGGGTIVRVTASAGSGKTTTLLQLAVHAVSNCQHQRINYATFTTAAAKDGKERMMKALAEASTTATSNSQKPAPPAVIEARTLHSFAYRLLEDFRQSKKKEDGEGSNNKSSPPRMWSDKKLQKWIAQVCEGDIDSFVTPCYRELHRRQDSSSSRSSLSSQSQANWLQTQQERAHDQVLFFIYKSLVLFTQSSMDIDTFENEKKMFGRDYYPARLFHKDKKGEDYGFLPTVYNRPDMISFYSDQAAKCWRRIQDDDDIRTFDLDMKRVQLLKLRIPGTILLVDESQDMDACQIDFIVHQQAELHNLHVYVVGDPAQAIYGFRGAKPKFLLQLGCHEKKLLTHTFRFGPGLCNVANLILFAKEKSDQTQYGKYDNQPINWDPYRVESGVPNKESIITTATSILKDWKSGQVALIARRNTTLLIEVLPLFGFSFNDADDDPTNGNDDDEDYEPWNISQDDEADTIRSVPTPVTQDDESDDDDYLPPSEHHLDPNEYENEDTVSEVESYRPDFPRVHLNGKGQASGRNLWLKTLRQVESAYYLYDQCSNDEDATGTLDPKQFPEFDKRRISWRSFVDEVEAKEMNKYSNVIGVITKCKKKTLEAMEKFRQEVIMKDITAADADIILTTCHSAKGMEWNRVQLCGDFIDLCEFKKKKDENPPPIFGCSSPNAKRQKKWSQWKFDFQSWGDETNLLYVACTRAKNELSIPPSSSLIRVAKSFDELHNWKLTKDAHPGMVTSAMSIDGVEKLIDEDEALGLYESLVVPLRHEYKLSADQRIATEIFGVSSDESEDHGKGVGDDTGTSQKISGNRSHAAFAYPMPHLHVLIIVAVLCLLPDKILAFSFEPSRTLWRHNPPRMQYSFHPLSNLYSTPPTLEGDSTTNITQEQTIRRPQDPASRFHLDMRRVLETKRALSEGDSTSPRKEAVTTLQSLDRRQRPEVLTFDVDGAIRVQAMLQHMVNIDVAREESFQIVLEALVNRGRLRWKDKDNEVVCAADEVGDLIDEVWELQDGKISSETCNLALAAYAACATPRGDRQYADKAQALLDRMVENGILPTEESYCYVINAWAWQQGNRQKEDCAQLAQDNLEILEYMSPTNETLTKSYDLVLEAWSKSPSKGAPGMAENALRKMEELRTATVTSYTNAILAWTKSRLLDGAPRAHDLLIEHIDRYELGELDVPELLAANSIITAWARSRRPQKAEEVLWKVLKLKSDSLTPDILTFNAVMNSYLVSLEDDPESYLDRMLFIVDYLDGVENAKLRPNAYTFRCLLKAWANSDRPEAACNTAEIVEKIHSLWESGDNSLDHSTAYYNIALNKLVRSDFGMARVMEIFRLLQASRFCRPDRISYTSILEACSKSDDSDAAETAFEHMNELIALYNEKEDAEMMPALRTYSFAIQALGKNPILPNVLKARDLLDHLVEDYETTNHPQLRPNTFPFNHLLNCAANCIGTEKEKLNAFQVATQTYNEMRKRTSVQPDSYTYFYWFKCCLNLLPRGDLQIRCISVSFNECRKDGYVNDRILSRVPNQVLIHALEKESKSSSLPSAKNKSERVKMKDLPPSWSRRALRM